MKLRILLLFIAVLAFAPIVAAQPDPPHVAELQFVNELRKRGDAALAMDYLQRLSKNPSPELAKEQPEGKFYNPYFASAHWIGMPPPLSDGQVTFDDGAPNKVDDEARDVAAFLAWAAEPKMEERKAFGFGAMIYLLIFSVLLWFSYKRIWRNVATAPWASPSDFSSRPAILK